ncbi:MAG: hypothetical protein ACLS90_03315 [Clostridia bacterium]
MKNKKVEGGTEIEIFTQIRKDIEVLDQVMYNQIVGDIQTIIEYEYEERDYILDHGLYEDSITEEEFKELSNQPIEYKFEHLVCNEGLFNSGKLGMYNVYSDSYEYKCYNMNDEYFLLNTFNEYGKILDKIFDKYSQFTKMNYFD